MLIAAFYQLAKHRITKPETSLPYAPLRSSSTARRQQTLLRAMRPALRGRQPGSASPVLLSFLTAVFLVAAISLLLLVSHPHHEALVDSASLVRPAAGVPAAGGAGSCAVHLSDTELGGDVVSWGANHKLDSAGACCAACSSTDACNGAHTPSRVRVTPARRTRLRRSMPTAFHPSGRFFPQFGCTAPTRTAAASTTRSAG